MKVGIYRHVGGYFPEALRIYEKILDYNNIDHVRLDINEHDFWDKIKELDLFIYLYSTKTDLKELANSILPIIQNYQFVNCFPNVESAWHYDDKVKEYYLLKQEGFSVIESHIFWDKPSAFKWLETASFPIVFKLKAGASSAGVMLVKNRVFAKKLINRMFGKGVYPNLISFYSINKFKDISFKDLVYKVVQKWYRLIKGKDVQELWERHKNYVFFQKFLPGNDYDTRVMLIGERAYAFLRYNRKNDFRASGSNLQDHDRFKIDIRCIQIAFQVSKRLKFKSMAYDFLFDENKEPLITEISHIFPMKRQWPGYWDSNLKWHAGNFWPQYFILLDNLSVPELIQPDIDINNI